MRDGRASQEARRAAQTAVQTVRAYSDDDRPLVEHALQATALAGGVAGLLAYAARTGRLPERIPASDIALLGIATHKISRIITRSGVADFVRAPFTRFEGPANLNEVNQEPRGQGMQRAMGELLACPMCLGTWVAGGLLTSLVFAPRFTRAVEAAFAGVTLSDFLHVAYAHTIEKVS
jgi:hypothetical protein